MPGPGTDPTDTTIYARARPRVVQITETYFFEYVLSANPDTRPSESPTGRIKIVVPYDGYKHFTPQAIRDVERQMRYNVPNSESHALIGYLTLANYKTQDLQDFIDAHAPHGSIPLRVPLAAANLEAEDLLRADLYSCVLDLSYSPTWPEDVDPVKIQIQPHDEDSLEPPDGLDVVADEVMRVVADEVMRQASFEQNLVLETSVQFWLPSPQPGRSPRVVRMSLDWPTITSFRSVELTVGGSPHPVKYNPVTRSLEWSDVEMKATEDQSGVDAVTYAATMSLKIGHADELYGINTLYGKLEIGIPDRLLSGMEARLFGSTGDLITTSRPLLQCDTRIVAGFYLELHDEFERRTLSPYQHLHFDGVIPDSIRVADIKAALADRGFHRPLFDRPQPQPEGRLRHYILTQRREGPDEMRLWLVIDGQSYPTERETKIPGGTKFTSTIESGELNVYMRGWLPGDSHRLTEEMNLLHLAIRSRFEHVRTTR